MKIIGITPIKNESPFIDSFASTLTKVCDKIIVLEELVEYINSSYNLMINQNKKLEIKELWLNHDYKKI